MKHPSLLLAIPCLMAVLLTGCSSDTSATPEKAAAATTAGQGKVATTPEQQQQAKMHQAGGAIRNRVMHQSMPKP